MNTDTILQAIRESLLAIRDPRFYETERGFQGQLLIELSSCIPKCFSGNREIIEQEYQKNLIDHGLTIRPDIIIHQPFDPDFHANRRQANLVVIELKLRAGQSRAVKDFENLHSMLTALDYPLGVFINIDSSHTQANHVPIAARGRIISFATRLTPDGVKVFEERA